MGNFRIRIKDGRTIGGYASDLTRINVTPGEYEARWGEATVRDGGDQRIELALTVLNAIPAVGTRQSFLNISSTEYLHDLENFPNINGTSSIEVLGRI
ncbi:hypothetical protein ACPRNU_20440 [Chromobacterium vaccinii]|uniref:hypothetical protein n=1 Tax=Chromobacterium TaxID=535 RepID=UPI0007F93E7E|nr:hypothetical protein [Chromobacterium subtsugae]OBU85479.1 hypothetical protein MY55_15990 [Chromobacterium subtsugae]